MMSASPITPTMTMIEILARYPETIPVFLAYRMGCIGCSLASFDSLEEALDIYGLPVEDVITALTHQIGTTEG